MQKLIPILALLFLVIVAPYIAVATSSEKTNSSPANDVCDILIDEETGQVIVDCDKHDHSNGSLTPSSYKETIRVSNYSNQTTHTVDIKSTEDFKSEEKASPSELFDKIASIIEDNANIRRIIPVAIILSVSFLIGLLLPSKY